MTMIVANGFLRINSKPSCPSFIKWTISGLVMCQHHIHHHCYLLLRWPHLAESRM